MAVRGLTLVSKDGDKRYCKYCQNWFPLDKIHWQIWSRTNRPTLQYDCRAKKFASKQKCKGSMKSRYSQLKGTAKERNHCLELTYQDYVDLVEDKDCHYCGDKLGGLGYNLDRIDPFKGYLHDNVVPCCKLCNQAKMDLSLEQFYLLVTKIYSRIEGEV